MERGRLVNDGLSREYLRADLRDRGIWVSLDLFSNKISPDSSHLLLPLVRPALDVWVEDYDDDVDPVAEHHHHGLVPINLHLKVYLYAPTFVRFLF